VILRKFRRAQEGNFCSTFSGNGRNFFRVGGADYAVDEFGLKTGGNAVGDQWMACE
jgi:hypothetical protein